MDSFRVSQRDMLDSLNRVLGTTDADWEIKYQPSPERYQEGIAELQKGIRTGLAKAMYMMCFPLLAWWNRRLGTGHSSCSGCLWCLGRHSCACLGLHNRWWFRRRMVGSSQQRSLGWEASRKKAASATQPIPKKSAANRFLGESLLGLDLATSTLAFASSRWAAARLKSTGTGRSPF